MHGVMLAEPFLNHLPLACQDDANPFDGSGTLVVFSHDVGGFVEYLDHPVSLVAAEVVGREDSLMFLHLLL